MIVVRDGVVRIKGLPKDLTIAEARALGQALLLHAREIARARGRRPGVAGGVARKAALSPERRSEIARQAARARWG